jgi:nitrate reductase gamma subunit
MEFFFGVILPYIAFSVFLTGTILRVIGWLRTPVPFQLTLFPVPQNTAGRIRSVATEFFFCRSLHREDKFLWLSVWLIHLSLLLVLAGHVLGIYFMRSQFTLIGLRPHSSVQMSLILGGITGVVMTFSIGALIYRRLVNAAVKRLSAPSNYFELLLLFALALSGISMYMPGLGVDLQAVRGYMGGLFGMHPVLLPRNATFFIHFLLVNILMIYFPFSSFMHSAGFFAIRSMLLEAPPAYPTPSGTVERSVFATRKLYPDIPVPRQTSTAGEGDRR